MASKKITLIFVPVWTVDMPPLGLAYLSYFLKNEGIDVEILDLNLYCYQNVSHEMKHYWDMKNSSIWVDDRTFRDIKDNLDWLFNLCIDKISRIQSDIIGFSVCSPNRLFAKELIREIKANFRNKLIIVGGRGVESLDERNVFEELVDIFVKGEGERTLKEIIENFYKGGSFNNIPGIKRIKDKEIKNFMPRNPIIPFDKLVFPKYKDFDLNAYGTKSLPLLMAKGCISRCAFCDDCNLMGEFRSKKAETVLEEIKYHVFYNKIRKFFFNDASINSNILELGRLCDSIIKGKLHIEWVALAIPYSKMDYSLLSKMSRAGCKTLNYGVESGSDKVLKKMGKIFTVFEAEKVIRDTRRAGINAQLNFITGFPGEEENEFKETLKFIERNKDYISGVTNINTCNALLESEIFKEASKYGIEFPEDLRIRDTQWFIREMNTPEIRTQRVRRVVELLKQFNIPIVISNVWEEEARDKEYKEKRMKPKIYSNEDKLTLVTMPPWGFENPPIGLGYLAEYMKSKNIDTEIIDLNIFFYNQVSPGYKLLWHIENKNFWSNEWTFPFVMEIFKPLFEESVEKILTVSSKMIGFSVVDPKERITIEVIKKIKEKSPAKKIILGGPATSTEQQRKIFLDNIPEYIDAFVIGEGEETLYDLVANFSNKRNFFNVPGTLTKNNENWKYIPRKPIEPVGKILFPTYDKFNLDLYDDNWLWVEWSRGCIGKCSFCKNYKLIPKYRAKSPQWVVNELKFHVEKNSINDFFIADNLLNGDLNQLEKICNLIIKGNLNIRWAGSMAPRDNMDYNFFRKMQKAGCYKLQIGLESGSNRVLERMRKIFTVDVSQKNLRDAKLAGIETEVFIMIGFPGEKEEDFKKTRDFIRRNSKFIDTIKSINTLHLIAGTDIYENFEKYNMRPLPFNNWHYLWETWDNNNYKARKERGKLLLEDACHLGIKVAETNLEEGKESYFDKFLVKDNRFKTSEVKEIFEQKINKLQDLKPADKENFTALEISPTKIGSKYDKKKSDLMPSSFRRRRHSFLTESTTIKEKPSFEKRQKLKLKLNFLYKFPLVLPLFFLGIIIDFYIWLLKRVRKCIIFPGS